MSSENNQQDQPKKAKAQTNEKKLKNLVADLDSIEAAFLRERLIHVGKTTKKSIDEEPDKWQPGIVNSYKSLCVKINQHLGKGEDPLG